MEKKKGQVSVEYLVVVGFVTFVVLGVLALAFFYVNGINDQIKFNQIDKLGNNLASTADVVYFAGEPSQKTIKGYIPSGVNSIQLIDNLIVFNVTSASGETIMSFTASENLTGAINSNGGVKEFVLIAESDRVSINSG